MTLWLPVEFNYYVMLAILQKGFQRGKLGDCQILIEFAGKSVGKTFPIYATQRSHWYQPASIGDAIFFIKSKKAAHLTLHLRTYGRPGTNRANYAEDKAIKISATKIIINGIQRQSLYRSNHLSTI